MLGFKLTHVKKGSQVTVYIPVSLVGIIRCKQVTNLLPSCLVRRVPKLISYAWQLVAVHNWWVCGSCMWSRMDARYAPWKQPDRVRCFHGFNSLSSGKHGNNFNNKILITFLKSAQEMSDMLLKILVMLCQRWSGNSVVPSGIKHRHS